MSNKQPIYQEEVIFVNGNTIGDYILAPTNEDDFITLRFGRKRKVYGRVTSNTVHYRSVDSSMSYMFTEGKTNAERIPLPPFTLYRVLKFRDEKNRFDTWRKERGYT